MQATADAAMTSSLTLEFFTAGLRLLFGAAFGTGFDAMAAHEPVAAFTAAFTTAGEDVAAGASPNVSIFVSEPVVSAILDSVVDSTAGDDKGAPLVATALLLVGCGLL